MSILYGDLSSTLFPNDLDNIISLLNVNSSDSNNIRLFQQFIMDGNFSQAQVVLNSIQNASRKVVDATYFNTIRDAVLALERFYKSDIYPYLEEQQEVWKNSVGQLQFLGPYSPGIQYAKNNYVSYIVNGTETIFIATADPPLGTAPTDTRYWRPLTVKGERGPSGPGASFMYDWAPSEIYEVQDIVIYQNRWFVAKVQNQNQPPFVGSPYWDVVIQLISMVYPVQVPEPEGQDIGQLWFQIIP